MTKSNSSKTNSEIEKIVKIFEGIKLAQTAWEYSEDIVTCNGKPIGGTITKHSREFDRWWRGELFREIVKALTDKFHIIPKTNSPEKHVEGFEDADKLFLRSANIKLKWKEDK